MPWNRCASDALRLLTGWFITTCVLAGALIASTASVQAAAQKPANTGSTSALPTAAQQTPPASPPAQAPPAPHAPIPPAPAAPPRFLVVLDAAHGGDDLGGHLSSGQYEKNANLALSVRLRSLLGARGIQVVTTRESDQSIDMNRRAAIANQRLTEGDRIGAAVED